VSTKTACRAALRVTCDCCKEVAAVPLRAVATLVAYSRVHTGVHYAVDVITGSVLGGAIAPIVVAALTRQLRGGIYAVATNDGKAPAVCERQPCRT
jgi:membrane-associated phospholipid phosphatase